eukprot:1985787-Alexandrium_andersonii.AAC.1
MTTRCCKGGAPTARTSRPMQPVTRLRSARRSFGASQPNALAMAARSLSACRAGWTAAWRRSTWQP